VTSPTAAVDQAVALNNRAHDADRGRLNVAMQAPEAPDFDLTDAAVASAIAVTGRSRIALTPTGPG